MNADNQQQVPAPTVARDLHELDSEVYLRDVFRVLPHWPRDYFLELEALARERQTTVHALLREVIVGFVQQAKR